MAIKSLKLENFTVFEELEMAFSPGINVFIGENGTGKTHLLKVLYSLGKATEASQLSSHNQQQHIFWKIFLNSLNANFQASHLEPGRLFRNYVDGKTPFPVSCGFGAAIDGVELWCTMWLESEYEYDKTVESLWSNQTQFITTFIPAKDMLTHGGLEKDFLDRNLPFDTTLIDILNKAGVSTKKNLDKGSQSLLDKIAAIIGGKVVYKNDRYYINRDDIGPIEFALEAEGYKKLGLIYRLIETGHICEGSALFWDEPEANLNPKLIPVVVDILLELARHGVQIFIATHDYVIAKYFEIRRTPNDTVLFHSLYKTDTGVKSESNTNFRDLKENPIITALDVLMDEVIDRNMGD